MEAQQMREMKDREQQARRANCLPAVLLSQLTSLCRRLSACKRRVWISCETLCENKKKTQNSTTCGACRRCRPFPRRCCAYLLPRCDAQQVREEHNAVFQAQLEVILHSTLQPQSSYVFHTTTAIISQLCSTFAACASSSSASSGAPAAECR